MTDSNAPKMISVFGSQMSELESQEVASSLQANWLGMGPKVKSFETQMAARLGARDFVMVDSGSNALMLAVRLLELPPGSEVIVPSFTWISCAHAVILNKCVPVFADVSLDTHNITRETIEAQRTERTRAVMVVHYAGKPVRMDTLDDLGVPIVEDAAHAVDSALCGRACGTIGDVGIYSFDAVKNIAVGEGGGLVARDPERAALARTLRYCGIGKSGFEASAAKDRWWEYHIRDVYPKMLPSDIAASIGLGQLARFDGLQARRKTVWEIYQREFADVPWLTRPMDPLPDERHSWFTYCVRVDGGRRDALAKYLFGKKIYTTLRYHPLHLNPIYGLKQRLAVSEQLNEEALSLPLHPNLSDADVERVVSAVREFDR